LLVAKFVRAPLQVLEVLFFALAGAALVHVVALTAEKLKLLE